MSLIGHLLNGAKHFMSDPVGAVSRFIDLNFGDGSIGGRNPAEIYAWFHSGPGTGSYDTSKATFDKSAKLYYDTANAVNNVQQQLATEWHGPASQAAQNVLTPVVSELDGMRRSAIDAGQQLGDQSHTFNDTKNKVTQVPEQPPQGGGLGILNPLNMVQGGVADLGVAEYQQRAHGNQDAYGVYGQATPPQQAGLPHDQGMTPQPTPDLSVDQGQQVQGYTGNVSQGQYVPSGPGGTGDGGQYSAAPTPGGAGAGGVASAPSVSGGGDAGGTSTQSVGPSQAPVAPGGVPGVGAPGGGAAASAPPMGGSWSGAGPGGGSGFSSPSFSGGAGGSGGLSGLNSEFGALGPGAVGGGGGLGGLGSDEVKGARGGRFGGGARGGGSGAAAEAGEGGRSGAGRAGAAAAAAEAEGRGLASGAKGAGGEGPMGPGGGRKREEDDEHKTATYLIHEEHGREVIGDMDGVAPEVIGESPEETAARRGE